MACSAFSKYNPANPTRRAYLQKAAAGLAASRAHKTLRAVHADLTSALSTQQSRPTRRLFVMESAA